MIRGLTVLAFAAATLQAVPGFATDSTARAASPEKAESAGGEVKKLPGGAVLRMTPGTRVKFDKPIRLQLAPSGNAKTLTHSVQLFSGRIEVDLPPSKAPATAVLIRGPQKISAVAKGGHSVVIAAPGRVTVAAVAGEMLAAAGNEWKTVASGVVREFASGTMVDHAVLPAPQLALSTPITFQIAGGEPPSRTTATATPVQHAKSYDFGLWKLSGGERSLVQRLDSAKPFVELPKLEAGSYAVTARAIEASGLESPESEAVPLRVVGAELPQGAKVVDGAVVLGQFQRVALKGVEGVEVSYGRAPQFVPAPSSIGLIRGQPTLVRMRAAGTTGELALSLEPRLVRADIQIGPRRARWPQDAVNVSVKLTDAHGRPLKSTSEVEATVHINVTKVPLEWKQKDNVLSTTVPQPVEAGPWVVRVEVIDKTTGVTVGHDFLEVATSDERRAQR